MFHIQSLWLIGALCTSTFGLLVLAVRKSFPDYLCHALTYSGLANLCLAGSFCLRIFIGHEPEVFSNVLGNTLASFCLGLELCAISELKRELSSALLVYGIPAATLGVSLWCVYVQRNITVNQLLFNLFNLILIVTIVWRVSRPEDGGWIFSDKVAAVAFGLLALSTLGVVLAFVFAGPLPREYDFSQPRATYSIISAITASALISSVFLLMVSERLNRELKVQALRDPLTGIYNRRAFEEIAYREMSGSKRSGLPFSLLMCDIDRFKSINDTYGHLAGDAVLVQVTQALRASLRDEDFLCRWGGDEFCALLPRVGAAEASVVARRMLDSLSGCKIDVADAQIDIEISVGVASGESFTGELPQLLKYADSAMYRAKQESECGYGVVNSANGGAIEFRTF